MHASDKSWQIRWKLFTEYHLKQAFDYFYEYFYSIRNFDSLGIVFEKAIEYGIEFNEEENKHYLRTFKPINAQEIDSLEIKEHVIYYFMIITNLLFLKAILILNYIRKAMKLL